MLRIHNTKSQTAMPNSSAGNSMGFPPWQKAGATVPPKLDASCGRRDVVDDWKRNIKNGVTRHVQGDPPPATSRLPRHAGCAQICFSSFCNSAR